METYKHMGVSVCKVISNYLLKLQRKNLKEMN